MIRCSSTSLKFANAGKLAKIGEFLRLYREAVKAYVDRFWDAKYAKFADDIALESPLSARAKQCAAKQALAIIAGTKRKYNARAYRIRKLTEAGEIENAKRLQAIQDRNPISKPALDNINAELDQRFVEMSLESPNAFDLWIKVKGLGIAKPFLIPLRKHKHFNKLASKGALKPSIRVSDSEVTFFFEIAPQISAGANIVGVDLGSKKTLCGSDGQKIGADKDGWTLDKIQKRLSARKKGSKGFARTQAHRENYVRWSVNNFDFSRVGEIKLEDLKGMRRGKRLNRFLQGWNYRDIVGVVERKCEERGVRVTYVPRQYTSQRCSECGKIEKRNRCGETYKCDCGFICDADVNAAKNIANLSAKVLDFRGWGAYSPPDAKNDSVGGLHDLPRFS
jgi:IS605 OrfB family transposase